MSSTVLAAEALKAAVMEAKAGNDVQRYKDAVAALRPHLAPGDPEGIVDLAWIERKEKQNKTESNRLEAELKGYKNNLIKESIRVRPILILSGHADHLTLRPSDGQRRPRNTLSRYRRPRFCHQSLRPYAGLLHHPSSHSFNLFSRH